MKQNKRRVNVTHRSCLRCFSPNIRSARQRISAHAAPRGPWAAGSEERGRAGRTRQKTARHLPSLLIPARRCASDRCHPAPAGPGTHTCPGITPVTRPHSLASNATHLGAQRLLRNIWEDPSWLFGKVNSAARATAQPVREGAGGLQWQTRCGRAHASAGLEGARGKGVPTAGFREQWTILAPVFLSRRDEPAPPW